MSPTAKLLAPTAFNLDSCAQLLRNGEVVAVPTETVYGLAGNALDESSARRIFEVKGRPLIDPLIVHFKSTASALKHIDPNPLFEKLAEKFWPGPLTLVLPKKETIPDLVTAGLQSVAIRVPSHPVFQSLLHLVEFPLAAPSANPFGYVSPTRAEHVVQTLGHRIPAILDGGPCDWGLESTIVDLRQPMHPCLLRPGPISAETISDFLKMPLTSHASRQPKNDTAQAAPGLLTQHYSPKTKMRLLDYGKTDMLPGSIPQGSALLLNQRPGTMAASPGIFWLSESGKLEEIAHNLFSLLQQLDSSGYKEILVERPKNEGIGRAINDRLTRAAAKRS